MYKVIGRLPINGNTAVTIEGSGKELKNGIYIKTENNVTYYVISVGFVRKVEGYSNPTTELLIDGNFIGEEFSIVQ